MTGIAAVHALERLGWRREAPALPPSKSNEAEEEAAVDSRRGAGERWLDGGLVVGLGSKREKGER
jgi:hypothetical protein